MATILLVEDEQQLAQLIQQELTVSGHAVRHVDNGVRALDAFDALAPDLVILDWMLPGLEGLEVCRRIRTRSIVPILMLTARAEELDRVLGLEVGADDYLTKPFSMRELLARTRALLRRIELMQPAEVSLSSRRHLNVGKLSLDLDGRTTAIAGEQLNLTPKEFDLLSLLAEQPGRAYSREYLLRRIWGDEYVGFDRTVDSHIVRLRKKLGPLGDSVVTVWGIGYKLVPE